MELNINHFKEKLEREQTTLEKELGHVGKRNPENPNDWVATPGDLNILPSDKNELADSFEELEERSGILNELEIQYNEVRAAITRIEEGAYGICANGGEPIPVERLEAFPAARTCIEHTP